MLPNTCSAFFKQEIIPKPTNKAFGVFLHKDKIVLVQASLPFLNNGQFAPDYHNRAFSQYRYVLIPIDMIVEKLKGRTFGSSLLGMVRYGGINRLNPYLARDLID